MSNEEERADIEREHRGCPPVVLVDSDPISRESWERAYPSSLAAEPAYPAHPGTVVFSFRAPDMTAHLPQPACSRSGLHPIAECGLWQVP